MGATGQGAGEGSCHLPGSELEASELERDQATMLAAAVRARCGPVGTWWAPDGYPHSLALCVIDSIQSIGVRYGSVKAVVRKYRGVRGPQADTDGAPELAALFAQHGLAWFTDKIGTHHKTSTHLGAPTKAEAIRQAADLLTDLAPTTLALRERAHDPALKDAWLALPGQGSGISWRYLLMLAGVPGVKPDRMVRRFVLAATAQPSSQVSNTQLERLVTLAAEQLGITPTLADHLIWRAQSGRGPRTVPEPEQGVQLDAQLLAGGEAGTRVHTRAETVTIEQVRTTPAGLPWAHLLAQTDLGAVRVAASPVIWARHGQDLTAGPVVLVGDLCEPVAGGRGLWLRGLAGS